MISIRGVGKSYISGPGEVSALADVNLDIRAGEFVAIVGPSGSGKSTLLNIIGCLDRPSSGTYELNKKPISICTDAELARLRNRTFGFVFQSFNLIPTLDVIENIETPLLYAGIAERARRELALGALSAVAPEIGPHRLARTLSAGEQQRVAIARAVVTEPSIILADEPTGSIDIDNARTVMRLLANLHREGRTVVVVTHNEAVEAYAQRSLRLSGGKLVPGTRKAA